PGCAGHDQGAVERAAPADLDHVAELLWIGGLAQDAMIEFFAARDRPLQQLHGAVDSDALLIAGNEERDRAFGLATIGGEMIEDSRKLTGDRPLHVDCAPAEQDAVRDIAGKWRMLPARFVARRDHVSMPGEDEMRACGSYAGIKIFHIIGAGLREDGAMDGESRAGQHVFEKR